MIQATGKDLPFDQSLLLRVLLSSFVVGLLAHGYCMTNIMFTHDGLDAIVSNEASGQIAHKIGIGRITQPLYYALRAYLAAPYLLVALALLWLSLANYFILGLFDIKGKWLSMLLSGLLMTSASFTLTCASYIHECDSYALAFCLSSLAVWLSLKRRPYAYLSPLCLAAAIGLYQAFISVAITLYMLLLIEQLIKGKGAKVLIWQSVQYLAWLISALCLYMAVTKLVWICMPETALNASHSVQSTLDSPDFAAMILNGKAYVRFFYRFFVPETYHVVAISVLNILLFIFTAVPMLSLCVRNKIQRGSWVLLFLLLLMLPVGMNVCEFVSSSNGHSLMTYAYSLVYLMPILVWRECSASSRQAMALTCYKLMLAMVIFSNVIDANHLYLHKRLSYQNGMAELTRMLKEIEGTEGYQMNQTEVVFVGDPALCLTNVPRLGFEHVQGVGIYPNTIGACGINQGKLPRKRF